MTEKTTAESLSIEKDSICQYCVNATWQILGAQTSSYKKVECLCKLLRITSYSSSEKEKRITFCEKSNVVDRSDPNNLKGQIRPNLRASVQTTCVLQSCQP